jgi:hypothetical protein
MESKVGTVCAGGKDYMHVQVVVGVSFGVGVGVGGGGGCRTPFACIKPTYFLQSLT